AGAVRTEVAAVESVAEPVPVEIEDLTRRAAAAVDAVGGSVVASLAAVEDAVTADGHRTARQQQPDERQRPQDSPDGRCLPVTRSHVRIAATDMPSRGGTSRIAHIRTALISRRGRPLRAVGQCAYGVS